MNSQYELKQFIDQCYRIKCLKHPDIVQLIGLCLDTPDGLPMMILPLFSDGNLKIFLQKCRGFSPILDMLPEVSAY